MSDENKVTIRLQFRLANGLTCNSEEDGVDTVTIAGMGGALIASILEKEKSLYQTVKRIITQPNIHAKRYGNGQSRMVGKLSMRRILKEDEKIYEIVVLEKGDTTYDE